MRQKRCSGPIFRKREKVANEFTVTAWKVCSIFGCGALLVHNSHDSCKIFFTFLLPIVALIIVLSQSSQYSCLSLPRKSGRNFKHNITNDIKVQPNFKCAS